jgi:Mg2+-importing ATPase
MRVLKFPRSMTPDAAASASDGLRSFWSMPTEDVLSGLQWSPSGLAADTAAERLASSGPNLLGERKRSDTPTLLLRQVTSPLVLLLIAAAVLSFALQGATNGIIILLDGRAVLITKGALKNVLDVCTMCEQADGTTIPLTEAREGIERRFVELSAEGYRKLGVAVRETGSPGPIDRNSEHDMIFLGLLALEDPTKPGIAATITALRQLGVYLKVITGDNSLVATSVGERVGVTHPRVLTGTALRALSDDALPVVAEEAADIVLLEPDLAVLEAGVREGRRTFSNTLKYVFMATSANFGNMFSMAGASLLLSFLPLLPKQILLTNLLTDLPELTISSDRVDADMIERPRRWDIGFIRRFMLTFGLVSSVFDYLTFGVLLWILHAGPVEFRTGWFVESVVSATLVVLVVRTRGSFLRSRPGRALLSTTLVVAASTLAIPYTPLGTVFGFVHLPPLYLVLMGFIVLSYLASAELAKRWFYRRVDV